MTTTDIAQIDESALDYIQSLTLLCVDDNKTTQLIYDSIFEDLVEDIIFADDGEDGYTKYKENEVDIIISDYQMPRLNGLEMIRRIREDDNKVPIILVTAIEEIDVIVSALRLNVNNFIKKPIKPNEVLDAITNVSKILIANRYLEEQRNKKLKELEKKDEYNSYQEDLAFQKELNILRNDFYYQMLECPECENDTNKILIDFLYQPLDVLSGDAYSARKISNEITFYLIVDGMGKGISASLSSMLMTAYINHTIDKLLEKDAFDFKELIHSSIEYIKPILLEEEAVAIDYILIDCHKDTLDYAKFAMPVSLMQNSKDEVIRIKSNNPPLCKWSRDFQVSQYDISDVSKFLFYSDGIVENDTKDGLVYANYIENDFLASFTKDNFKKLLLEKIDTQDDDITLIFINKLDFTTSESATKEFETKLESVDEANEWYTHEWQNMCNDTKLIYNANVVFTELFMNAYEHGNLGIDATTKNMMIEDDNYIESLLEKEQYCDKKIKVNLYKIIYKDHTYVITAISDEGDGFDTQMLSTIFRNSQTFNGRGVFVSRQSSMGIYYNAKGNSVLYLHKI